MPVACPACGNAKSFQVKTLQMHVIHVDGTRVDVTEDNRPVVSEVPSPEGEAATGIAQFHDDVRREILLMLGAR